MVTTLTEHGNLQRTLPDPSPDALANSSSLDEMHIVVQDEDGQLTGITGEILEVFEGVLIHLIQKTVKVIQTTMLIN